MNVLKDSTDYGEQYFYFRRNHFQFGSSVHFAAFRLWSMDHFCLERVFFVFTCLIVFCFKPYLLTYMVVMESDILVILLLHLSAV